MPKLKTNKSVRKRFRFTSTGKLKKQRAGKRHLLEGKSSKRKRHLRQADRVSGSMEKSIRSLLPYG